MTGADIIGSRLATQGLVFPLKKTIPEIVGHLCAVQSQDYGAAKWALGARLPGVSDSGLDELYNSGAIIRTHVMRPTWHFVLPEDVKWMQQLTAHRVHALLNNTGKKLGLDEAVYRKSNKIIAKALKGGNYLMRSELEDLLNKGGIATGDLVMIHIMMKAELDCIVCNGPRKGKQFTYALFDERIRDTNPMLRDEALATLFRRYIEGHGPATLQDFAWWSGLTMTDAKDALSFLKSKLFCAGHEGQEYWYSGKQPGVSRDSTVFLLPNFDEYTVAYKDRSILHDIKKTGELTPFTLLGNLIIINGYAAGTWKKTVSKDHVTIEPSYFHAVKTAERKMVAEAAEAYGDFLGLRAIVK